MFKSKARGEVSLFTLSLKMTAHLKAVRAYNRERLGHEVLPFLFGCK